MKKVLFCKFNDQFYKNQQEAGEGLGKCRQTISSYIKKGYIVAL